MKIIDVKCAVIGRNPVVRIVTDQGISGYGGAETFKPYLKPFILHYRELLLGMDPTNVERCMIRIRNRGAFKPWGAAVSAIEMALWDLAGKAAGVPVYKLLGGKVRDHVRVYNGSLRKPLEGHTPEHYAAEMRRMLALPEGFTLVKQGVAFHSGMVKAFPDFHIGISDNSPIHSWNDRGQITLPVMGYVLDCVDAMVEALDGKASLALDCGPGWMLTDAIRFARAVEKHNLLWLEDMLTGDYIPYVNADVYRELTVSTTTPIHTGEQIYLRQNFKDLIEKKAVRVVGPDPADVGGIAELKWIAEYADLHGIMMAPHGTGNGLLGLAALVQVGATLPGNYIAFELPSGSPEWWYDIVDGLPNPIVQGGLIEVWDRPGMGVELNPERTRPYLAEEDHAFFE